MDLLAQVRDYINGRQMIDAGTVVLVAVSGGPDSVALLHVLHCLANEGGFSLHIAHLNHMFRGAEAETDAEFVGLLAQKYGLPAVIETIDVPAYRGVTGLSAQAAAREVRYGFLQDAARRIGAGRIALAHHADDQAETILMNFLRGAGTGGLKGITPVRENLFIRPFLPVRRAQIEDYCRIMKLSFRTDSSNAKPVYLRNRVRMELLPLLAKEYNARVVEAMLRQGEICRLEDSYMQEQAALSYRAAKVALPEGGLGLKLTALRQMPPAILRRVFRLIWQDLTGSQRNLDFTHVERLSALPGNRVGARIPLPGGVTAVLSYISLDFHSSLIEQQVDFYQYPLSVPGETNIPEIRTVLRASLLRPDDAPEPSALPTNEALLDLTKLPAQIFVRRRLPGDMFQPYGQQKPMKLKKFLINQKVLRGERDNLPLVCTTEEIIWIAGQRVGEKWKVTGDTDSILYLQMFDEKRCYSLHPS